MSCFFRVSFSLFGLPLVAFALKKTEDRLTLGFSCIRWVGSKRLNGLRTTREGTTTGSGLTGLTRALGLGLG
jgi:hypothetical protein